MKTITSENIEIVEVSKIYATPTDENLHTVELNNKTYEQEMIPLITKILKIALLNILNNGGQVLEFETKDELDEYATNSNLKIKNYK